MPFLWATVNRRNLQIFRIESIGCSPGRAPFLGKGEELGLSRNAADSQSGVSRYDQTPQGSGDVEDLFYELVKGCHMRPRGCSYVVCIRFTLQGFKSIRIAVCLSDMSTAVSWAIFASNLMKQRIGSKVGSWYLWLCWQKKVYNGWCYWYLKYLLDSSNDNNNAFIWFRPELQT